MLYSEIIALCSDIQTKHINTVCGQNVELLNVKLVVNIVTMDCKVLNVSHHVFHVKFPYTKLTY